MLAPDSTKRLDKLTILKMTVSYLKMHNGNNIIFFIYNILKTI